MAEGDRHTAHPPGAGALPRLTTGIPGLDRISGGGLPRGAVTLLAGTTGTGKSVLAAQFLAAGITRYDEPGVFVTLEERPEQIRRFTASFGWDIAGWEAQGSWAFLDAAPDEHQEVILGDDLDFTPFSARVAAAVQRIGAQRVVVDSVSDVLNRIGNGPRVRAELHRLVRSFEALGVTTVVTAERDHDHGSIARFGVEDFVADNVIILRNTLEQEHRRRTIEALKLRGTTHLTGEYPFAILPDEGVTIASLTDLELTHPSTDDRVRWGNAALDEMCGGGPLRDSVILVSGPTGSGKSLLTLEFAAAAGEDGRTLLFGFEESQAQLTRNARGWGHDLDALQSADRLKVRCQYPEALPLPIHLIAIQREVEQFRPTRVVVDSLSGLERAAPPREFHEFLLGLTSFLKARQITTVLTTTTPALLGGATASGVEASTLLDSIILMRYVEARGELHRGISVLKMRGSDHTKAIRQFTITGQGLQIGDTFKATTGILAGRPLIGDGDAPVPTTVGGKPSG